ncbi:MAG: hypothetical protein IT342_11245 [Candidatus Melainabacteria bacterium]|nr:hypothetical protein [Candidatus Melainabacteria bacterium]
MVLAQCPNAVALAIGEALERRQLGGIRDNTILCPSRLEAGAPTRDTFRTFLTEQHRS